MTDATMRIETTSTSHPRVHRDHVIETGQVWFRLVLDPGSVEDQPHLLAATVADGVPSFDWYWTPNRDRLSVVFRHEGDAVRAADGIRAWSNGAARSDA